jgi:hypothetical protein
MRKLITFLCLTIVFVAQVDCSSGAYPEEPAPNYYAEEISEEIMTTELLLPQIDKLVLSDATIASQCRSAVDISETACSELPSYNSAVVDEPSGPVVILIVDDFGSEPLWQLPKSNSMVYNQPEFSLITGEPTAGDNCLMSPGGQGFFSSEGSGVGQFPIPHGELVFEKFEQILSSWTMPLIYAEDTQDCWKRKVRLYGDEPYQILLVGVDTQNYNTQTVGNNIDAAIAEFGSYENQLGLPPSNRFVINMSFAIIPCDAYTDTDATAENVHQLSMEVYELAAENAFDPGLQTLAGNLGNATTAVELPDAGEAAPAFDELVVGEVVANDILLPSRILGGYPNFFDFYDPSLLNAPPEEVLEYLDGLNKYFDADVLLQLLNCYADREMYPHIVISVASAGNFYSYPYPFMPALLQSVVSISSDYSDLPDACQNIAKTAGSNPGEINEFGGYVIYEDKCYLGTSFAAPLMSSYIAWKLMVFGDFCDVSYATEYGGWENFSFDYVLDRYCPSHR